MSNVLVAYFSAGGVTAGVARELADTLKAELCEIVPVKRYTEADLDWRDVNSRSSIEMRDKASRPEIEKPDMDVDAHDVILLGFPIWWYVAPTIVNAFLEKHDFSGKRIILFATSGGSSFGDAAAYLKGSVAESAVIEEGMLQKGCQDMDAWKKWAIGLDI